jgi:hypothetical protein
MTQWKIPVVLPAPYGLYRERSSLPPVMMIADSLSGWQKFGKEDEAKVFEKDFECLESEDFFRQA